MSEKQFRNGLQRGNENSAYYRAPTSKAVTLCGEVAEPTAWRETSHGRHQNVDWRGGNTRYWTRGNTELARENNLERNQVS